MDLLDDMDISDTESDEFESDLGDEDWVENIYKSYKLGYMDYFVIVLQKN